MKPSALKKLIEKKTSLLLQLELAKAANKGVAKLASQVAALEGKIATVYLSSDRKERAAINLVSQASCLVDAGKRALAVEVLQKAHKATQQNKLRSWIVDEIIKLQKSTQSSNATKSTGLDWFDVNPAPVSRDMKFSCPHCEQHLQCDQRLGGKQIQCPACKHLIEIPPSPVSAKTVETGAATFKVVTTRIFNRKEDT